MDGSAERDDDEDATSNKENEAGCAYSEFKNSINSENIQDAVAEIKKGLVRRRKVGLKLLNQLGAYFYNMVEAVKSDFESKNIVASHFRDLQDLILETTNLCVSLSTPSSRINECYDLIYDLGAYIQGLIVEMHSWNWAGQVFGDVVRNLVESLIKVSCENPDEWLYSEMLYPLIFHILNVTTSADHAEFRTKWAPSLADLMGEIPTAVYQCGDFSCQYYLMTIFSTCVKWTSDDPIKFVNSMFPQVDSCTRKELVSEMDKDTAELKLRKFLNAFNLSIRGPKSVIPIDCLYIFVCDNEIQPPECTRTNSDFNFCVDFSIQSGRLHTFYSTSEAPWLSLSIRKDQIDSVCLNWVTNNNNSESQGHHSQDQTPMSLTSQTFMKDEKVFFFHVLLNVDFGQVTKDHATLVGRGYRSINFVFKNGELVERILKDMGYHQHHCGTKHCRRPSQLRNLLTTQHKLNYTKSWCPESQVFGLDETKPTPPRTPGGSHCTPSPSRTPGGSYCTSISPRTPVGNYVPPDIFTPTSSYCSPRTPGESYCQKPSPRSPVRSYCETTSPKTADCSYCPTPSPKILDSSHCPTPSPKSPVCNYSPTPSPKTSDTSYCPTPSPKSPVCNYSPTPSPKTSDTSYCPTPSPKSQVSNYCPTSSPKNSDSSYCLTPSPKSPVSNYYPTLSLKTSDASYCPTPSPKTSDASYCPTPSPKSPVSNYCPTPSPKTPISTHCLTPSPKTPISTHCATSSPKASDTSYCLTPSPKTPVSNYCPTPSPKTPVSNYCPTPSPKTPVSNYCPTPSPKTPISTHCLTPSPKTPISTHCATPSPKASDTSYCLTPSPKTPASNYCPTPSPKASDTSYCPTPSPKSQVSNYCPTSSPKNSDSSYCLTPSPKTPVSNFCPATPSPTMLVIDFAPSPSSKTPISTTCPISSPKTSDTSYCPTPSPKTSDSSYCPTPPRTPGGSHCTPSPNRSSGGSYCTSISPSTPVGNYSPNLDMFTPLSSYFSPGTPGEGEGERGQRTSHSSYCPTPSPKTPAVSTYCPTPSPKVPAVSTNCPTPSPKTSDRSYSPTPSPKISDSSYCPTPSPKTPAASTYCLTPSPKTSDCSYCPTPSPKKTGDWRGQTFQQRKPVDSRGVTLSPITPVGSRGVMLSPRTPVGSRGQSLSPRTPVGSRGQSLSPRTPVGSRGQSLSPRTPVGSRGLSLSPRTPGLPTKKPMKQVQRKTPCYADAFKTRMGEVAHGSRDCSNFDPYDPSTCSELDEIRTKLFPKLKTYSRKNSLHHKKKARKCLWAKGSKGNCNQEKAKECGTTKKTAKAFQSIKTTRKYGSFLQMRV